MWECERSSAEYFQPRSWRRALTGRGLSPFLAVLFASSDFPSAVGRVSCWVTSVGRRDRGGEGVRAGPWRGGCEGGTEETRV